LEPGTIKLELDTIQTSPSYRVLLAPIGGAGPTIPFVLSPTGAYTIGSYQYQLIGTTGSTVYTEWDDGSAPTTSVMTGAQVFITHTYASAGTYHCTITGDTDQLTVIGWHQLPLSFNLDDIPTSLHSLSAAWSATITGALGSCPSGMLALQLGGDLSGVTGTMANLPSTLTHLEMRSTVSNTNITGTINDLTTSSLTNLTLSNLDSVTGSISNLASEQAALWTLYLYNNGNITGSISDLVNPLDELTLITQSGITGSISSLPSSLYMLYMLSCGTSITGSISSLPTGLGSIYLNDIGTNITGSINSLPSTLTFCEIYPANNLTGSLSGGLPSGLTSLLLTNGGTGMTGGDIASLPAGITRLNLSSNSCTYTYSSGRSWANYIWYVTILPANGYGLTSTQVDNLIIDLANQSLWTMNKNIYLNASNANRTTASNAAVSTLTGYGVTVYANGP
jgi:hypothetical protein